MRSDKSKRKPDKKSPKISSADKLTKTSESRDVELEEKRLTRVAGGLKYQEYKIK
jgi:hypothetical protein